MSVRHIRTRPMPNKIDLLLHPRLLCAAIRKDSRSFAFGFGIRVAARSSVIAKNPERLERSRNSTDIVYCTFFFFMTSQGCRRPRRSAVHRHAQCQAGFCILFESISALARRCLGPDSSGKCYLRSFDDEVGSGEMTVEVVSNWCCFGAVRST